VYYKTDQDENWSYLFSNLRYETDASERNKLMIGLAGIQSAKILAELVLNLLSFSNLLSLVLFINNIYKYLF
jgi:hypothetical protein